MALGTRTKFQLEILISTILVIYKFREIILEGSRNVSETPPRKAHIAATRLCNSLRGYPQHARNLHYQDPFQNKDSLFQV